jgi:hypothetical protein
MIFGAPGSSRISGATAGGFFARTSQNRGRTLAAAGVSRSGSILGPLESANAVRAFSRWHRINETKVNTAGMAENARNSTMRTCTRTRTVAYLGCRKPYQPHDDNSFTDSGIRSQCAYLGRVSRTRRMPIGKEALP